MSESLPLLAGMLLLFVVPIVLVARAAPGRVALTAGLWFLSPLGLLAAVLFNEAARKPGDKAVQFEKLPDAIGFAIGLGIIPWGIIWSVGMAIALMLRRRWPAKALQASAAGPELQAAAVVPTLALPTPRAPAKCQGMTTEDLHQRVLDLAHHHGWPERLLPIVYARDNDTPYVEVDQRGFHLATYDRGQAHGERQTQDLEEMLYWVAELVTFHMASEEVARGISHFDEFAPRLLARQDSMLAEMNPQWHQRWLTDATSHAAFYRRKVQN